MAKSRKKIKLHGMMSWCPLQTMLYYYYYYYYYYFRIGGYVFIRRLFVYLFVC